MELSWNNINAFISEPRQKFNCLNKLLNKKHVNLDESKESSNYKKIIISDGITITISLLLFKKKIK